MDNFAFVVLRTFYSSKTCIPIANEDNFIAEMNDILYCFLHIWKKLILPNLFALYSIWIYYCCLIILDIFKYTKHIKEM